MSLSPAASQVSHTPGRRGSSVGRSQATGWSCFCSVSKQVGPRPRHVKRDAHHCHSRLQAVLGSPLRGQIQFYLSTIPAGLPPSSLGERKHDSGFLSESPAMIRYLHEEIAGRQSSSDPSHPHCAQGLFFSLWPRSGLQLRLAAGRAGEGISMVPPKPH